MPSSPHVFEQHIPAGKDVLFFSPSSVAHLGNKKKKYKKKIQFRLNGLFFLPKSVCVYELRLLKQNIFMFQNSPWFFCPSIIC